MPRISKRLQPISPSGIRKFFDMARMFPDAISLGAGEPDFTTPDHVIEAGIRALQEGYTHYTSNFGFPELCQAISEKLEKENDCYYDPKDEILVTLGSSEALFIALAAILDEGDEVLLLDPFYIAYEPLVRLFGANPVYVPLSEEKEWNPELEEVEKRITNRTKAMIVLSPSNPTGAVYTRETIEGLAELAKRHDLFVISDEIYEKIIYDDARHFSIAAVPGMKERTFLVNGFSKAYAMTGWRIGFLACDRKLMQEVLKIHQYMAICAPAVAQKAALAALQGPQDPIQRMVKEYDRRRQLIYNELCKINGVKVVKPKGAFYIFPNFREVIRGKESVLDDFLKKYEKPPSAPAEKLMDYIFYKTHVVTVGGNFFGEVGIYHLRMSYATSYEKIQQAMEKIREAISEL